MGNLQQGTSRVREVLANQTQQGLAEGRPGGQTSPGGWRQEGRKPIRYGGWELLSKLTQQGFC